MTDTDALEQEHLKEAPAYLLWQLKAYSEVSKTSAI